MNVDEDICRVCRSGSTRKKPLFYPCSCTGSVKYVHQQCLQKWLNHSKKRNCEICGYKFRFIPVYTVDAPQYLMARDIFEGLMKKTIKFSLMFFNYALVLFLWFLFLPIFSYRFSYGTFFLDLAVFRIFHSYRQLYSECAKGYLVTGCCLFFFIGFLWLKEQASSYLSSMQVEETNADNENHSNDENSSVSISVESSRHVESIDEERLTNENETSNISQDSVESNANEESETSSDGNNNGFSTLLHLQDSTRITNENVETRWTDLDMSFEQFFGFDGSKTFLENIFWVMCLNSTTTIFIGAIPFHFGRFLINLISIKIPEDPFGILLSLFIGYFPIINTLLFISHFICTKRISNFFRYTYIIMKIVLMMILEIGILPMSIGIILNINSLRLFGATLNDRIDLFIKAPGSSIVVHWLIGMFYIFYVALFFVLMKEAFRPGIFWFLKHLNDPNFNPIRQIISKPLLKQIIGFLKAFMLMTFFVMSTMGFPILIVDRFIPKIFPYIFSWRIEAASFFLPLELVIIHVAIPTLIENSSTKSWIRALVCLWGLGVSKLLNIESYLMGTVHIKTDPSIIIIFDESRPWPKDRPIFRKLLPFSDIVNSNRVTENSYDVYCFQPYYRTSFFKIRIFFLLLITGLTLSLLSVMMFVIPITIGRLELNALIGKSYHDSYTSIIGMYNIVILFHFISFILFLRSQINIHEFCQNLLKICKILLYIFVFIIIIPNLLGFAFQKIILVPIHAPFKQCALYIWWIEWAFGLLLSKTIILCLLIGPDCGFQRILIQIQSIGFLGLPFSTIMNSIALPVISYLTLFFSIPNLIVDLIRFYDNGFFDERILQCSHLIALICIFSFILVSFMNRKYSMVYEQIKNEKYLVGFVLINKDNNDQTTVS